MQRHTNFSLRSLNTFGVDARAAGYVRFESETELIDFLDRCPLGDRPHLILGEGSNLLFVGDVEGIVLHPCLKGVQVVAKDQTSVRVRVMAGEKWDDLVALAVANGWGGLENLSLIPGSVGASVVQNIGAYGVEVKEVVCRVEAVSLKDGQSVVFSPADCGFGYRTSNFKTAWAGAFLITAVTFQFSLKPQFVLDYPGVEKAVSSLGNVCLETIRRAIVGLRNRKLPDPADIGNAGSFFKNPVVDTPSLEALIRCFPGLAHYRQTAKTHKLAAGWLIETCGFKGKRLGQAAVHEDHALVLVNLGGASGQEILILSEQVRSAVFDLFGIWLEREVQVVPTSSEFEYKTFKR